MMKPKAYAFQTRVYRLARFTPPAASRGDQLTALRDRSPLKVKLESLSTEETLKIPIGGGSWAHGPAAAASPATEAAATATRAACCGDKSASSGVVSWRNFCSISACRGSAPAKCTVCGFLCT